MIDKLLKLAQKYEADIFGFTPDNSDMDPESEDLENWYDVEMEKLKTDDYDDLRRKYKDTKYNIEEMRADNLNIHPKLQTYFKTIEKLMYAKERTMS